MARTRISHYDGNRCENELVIYKRGEKTGTNAYGTEAVVIDDRVVKVGSNNNDIPNGGFVISGHGLGARFIGEEISLGCRAYIEGDELIVLKDDEAKKIELRMLREDIIKRLEVRSVDASKDEIEVIHSELALFDEDIKCGSFDTALERYRELYYLTALSKKGEIRAIWHRPHEKNEEEVENTIIRLKKIGFGVLLVETNYSGVANARKTARDFLPLRKELLDNDFDPIGAFVKYGKKHGMEIHAWVEDFFFGIDGQGCKAMELYPELIARNKDGSYLMDAYKTFIFLNPASERVHDMLFELYRDLLDNYDLDGIQLDYIRYPVIHGVDGSAGFEEETLAMFLEETGIDARDIADIKDERWQKFIFWRAARITKFVERMVALVRSYKDKGRSIKISTAVFGDPNEAIQKKCQDWRYWSQQGWLDFISPMAYFVDAKDVGKEVKHMVENYPNIPNIAGIAPMYNHLATIESTRQVEECRLAGAAGVAFFATNALTDEQAEKLIKGVFRD